MMMLKIDTPHHSVSETNCCFKCIKQLTSACVGAGLEAAGDGGKYGRDGADGIGDEAAAGGKYGRAGGIGTPYDGDGIFGGAGGADG